MFSVVMGLEEGEADVVLKGDAAYTPHITWLGPAQLEDDLWGSVVASGDDGAVVFVVKGGAAEVHHAHSRALHAALIPLLL